MEGQKLMPSGAGNTLGAANLYRRSAMGSIPAPRFYVYILCRPNGKPFYVGKGSGDRVFRHELDARKGHRCYRCNVIRKIWKQGGQVQRYIIFEADDEQAALDYEIETIALYGLDTLSNITSGGEGMSGVKQTPERKALQSKIAKETWADPEIRARRVAANGSARISPEERARRSARAKAMWSDPEHRKRISEKGRRRYADPAEREKSRAQAKQRFEDPEYREHHRHILAERNATPEMRALTAERNKTPEMIAVTKKPRKR